MKKYNLLNITNSQKLLDNIGINKINDEFISLISGDINKIKDTYYILSNTLNLFATKEDLSGVEPLEELSSLKNSIDNKCLPENLEKIRDNKADLSTLKFISTNAQYENFNNNLYNLLKTFYSKTINFTNKNKLYEEKAIEWDSDGNVIAEPKSLLDIIYIINPEGELVSSYSKDVVWSYPYGYLPSLSIDLRQVNSADIEFMGWVINENLSSVSIRKILQDENHENILITPGTRMYEKDNQTLYPVFKFNSHISYDLNGGLYRSPENGKLYNNIPETDDDYNNIIDFHYPVSKKLDSEIEKSLTKKYYEFDGWCGGTSQMPPTSYVKNNPEGWENAKFQFNKPFVNSVTLSAMWKPRKYDLKYFGMNPNQNISMPLYYDNDGSLDNATEHLSVSQKLVDKTLFNKVGYDFVYWTKFKEYDYHTMDEMRISAISEFNRIVVLSNAVLDYSTFKMDGDENIDLNSKPWLYACYKPISYTIKLHPGRGIGTEQTLNVEYDQKIKFPKNEFTRTGYTFAGWTGNPNKLTCDHVQGDYPDESFIPNLTLTDNDTINLSACWVVNKFVVNYHKIAPKDFNAHVGEYGTETNDEGTNQIKTKEFEEEIVSALFDADFGTIDVPLDLVSFNVDGYTLSGFKVNTTMGVFDYPCAQHLTGSWQLGYNNLSDLKDVTIDISSNWKSNDYLITLPVSNNEVQINRSLPGISVVVENSISNVILKQKFNTELNYSILSNILSSHYFTSKYSGNYIYDSGSLTRAKYFNSPNNITLNVTYTPYTTNNSWFSPCTLSGAEKGYLIDYHTWYFDSSSNVYEIIDGNELPSFVYGRPIPTGIPIISTDNISVEFANCWIDGMGTYTKLLSSGTILSTSTFPIEVGSSMLPTLRLNPVFKLRKCHLSFKSKYFDMEKDIVRGSTLNGNNIKLPVFDNLSVQLDSNINNLKFDCWFDVTHELPVTEDYMENYKIMEDTTFIVKWRAYNIYTIVKDENNEDANIVFEASDKRTTKNRTITLGSWKYIPKTNQETLEVSSAKIRVIGKLKSSNNKPTQIKYEIVNNQGKTYSSGILVSGYKGTYSSDSSLVLNVNDTIKFYGFNGGGSSLQPEKNGTSTFKVELDKYVYYCVNYYNYISYQAKYESKLNEVFIKDIYI